MTLRTAIAALLLCASIASAGWLQWYETAGAARRGGAASTDPTTNGIVAWWRITAADSGAYVADWSGNGHYLTQGTSSAWFSLTSDGTNVWGSFDGGDAAATTNTAILNGATATMVSVWINVQGTPSAYAGALITRGTGNNFHGVDHGSAAIGLLSWREAAQTPNSSVPFASYSNVWLHVVGAWDGVTNRIYTNGVLANGAASAAANAVNAAWYLGRDTGQNYWRGYIDDARLYSVQNTNQIRLIYEAGRK